MNILERYLKNKGDTLYAIVDGKIIAGALLVLLPSDTPGMVLVREKNKLKFITGEIEIKVIHENKD